MNHRKVPVSKLKDGKLSISSDDLAVETVVYLYFNEQKIATLLASPNDCENLFIGHLLSEGYIERAQAKICLNDVIITSSK
ncbi:MAG: formate dehydrogenase accessory sulfurtransferase FdhD, partial [Candidatus Thermoplasmatota archaeon]|nr:formate dehydrogenase accessory sulfurtransferase FdhD [Candidatus Thermoplasmatota archaeon]